MAKDNKKKINWGFVILIELFIIMFVQVMFISIDTASIRKDLRLHNKIMIEALACAEDPFCTITPDEEF